MKTLMMALALWTAAVPVIASAATLTVVAKDEKGVGVAGAAVTVTPQGALAENLTTSVWGSVACEVPTNTKVKISIKAAGFSTFQTTQMILAPDQWGTATVTMMAPRNGNSRLSEWRTGRSGGGEDPAGGDKARFNFYVLKNSGGAPIAGARVTVSRLNGTVHSSLTTNDLGYAHTLVPEGSVMTVTVEASGYKAYNTNLAPGNEATIRNVTIRLRAQ